LDTAETVRYIYNAYHTTLQDSAHINVGCYCSVALATSLLKGLRCFTITAAGATSAKSVPMDSKNTPIPRPTKQQAAKAKKRDNDMGEANAVTTVPLSISQVESTAFYSYLDVAVGMSNITAYPGLHASNQTIGNMR